MSGRSRRPGATHGLLLLLASLAALATLIVGGALFTECREYGEGSGPGPVLILLGGVAIAGITIDIGCRLQGWSFGGAAALGVLLGGLVAFLTYALAWLIQFGNCFSYAMSSDLLG